MDCPRCNIELGELTGEEMVLRRCGQCSGVWGEFADLNKVLLHHNLPSVQSVGGRMNVDAAAGQCTECQVDLVAVEGGEKRALQYAACEVCGGAFVDVPDDAVDLVAAIDGVVDFFRRFSKMGGPASHGR